MRTLLAAWCVVMKSHEGIELIIDPHDNEDDERSALTLNGRAVGRAPWELHADAWATLRFDRQLEPRPRAHQAQAEPNSVNINEDVTDAWMGRTR